MGLPVVDVFGGVTFPQILDTVVFPQAIDMVDVIRKVAVHV